MHKRTLITFATLLEAQATLDLLNARSISQNVWEVDQGLIIITGIGIVNAAAALAPWISQCNEVWNLGIAGALTKKHQLGEILEVSTTSRYLGFSEYVTPHYRDRAHSYHPPISNSTTGVTLLTSDWAIHSAEEAAILAPHGDLVDMEGYGIAAAAKAADKPWRSHKIISDWAQEGGSTLIKSVLPKLSEQLAHFCSTHNYATN